MSSRRAAYVALHVTLARPMRDKAFQVNCVLLERNNRKALSVSVHRRPPRVPWLGMSAPSHTPGTTAGSNRKAFIDYMVDGVLLALLFLVVLRIAVPGFQGWYHEDDFHNLRWTLEYRSEPWKALTERHALHDHVRPMTLMTLWLGTFLGDGAYWGQHLVLVLLHVAGLAAAVTLGRSLTGRLRAGLLAGLLVTGTWGWERLLDWNALMNTAGEVAFGLWALVAVRRGLERPIWLVVAGLAVVISALYKEPGSFVYPLAAMGIAWGAWRRGESVRRPLAVVALGLAVFAFTWHAANVSRLGGESLSTASRVLLFLESHASNLLSAWPGNYHDGKLVNALAGIPVFLFALVSIRDIVGPALMERPLVRVLWLCGAGLMWLAVALKSTLVGHLLFPTVVVVLLRRWREPPLGLLLYVVSVGVMSPFAQINEVQILAGTYGLALYLAVGADEALERRQSHGRTPQMVMLSGVLLSLGMLCVRLAILPSDSTWAMQRETEESLLGWGAAVRSLGVNYGQAAGMSSTEQEVLPLVGIGLKEADPNLAPTVAVGGKLLLMPAQGTIENVLIPNDVIMGAEIPILARGQDTEVDDTKGPQGMSIDVAPGWWALGVATSMGGRMQLVLQASDICGNTWQASQMQSIPVPFNLTPFYLSRGCSPLKLSWVGESESPDGLALLTSLQEPIISLWHPIEIQRQLPVSRRTNENAK